MSTQHIRLYERLAAAAWVYVLYFGGYGLINRRLRVEDCFDLTLKLDRHIPLVSEFVAPFYLAYLIVLVPALVIRDKPLLRHAIVAFTALVMVSCLTFVAFPTYVPRPTLPLRSRASATRSWRPSMPQISQAARFRVSMSRRSRYQRSYCVAKLAGIALYFGRASPWSHSRRSSSNNTFCWMSWVVCASRQASSGRPSGTSRERRASA